MSIFFEKLAKHARQNGRDGAHAERENAEQVERFAWRVRAMGYDYNPPRGESTRTMLRLAWDRDRDG